MPDLLKGLMPLLQSSGLGQELPKAVGAGVEALKRPPMKKKPADGRRDA